MKHLPDFEATTTTGRYLYFLDILKLPLHGQIFNCLRTSPYDKKQSWRELKNSFSKFIFNTIHKQTRVSLLSE